MPEVKLRVRCVLCKSTKDIGPTPEMPFCDKCYGPMIAESATVTAGKRRRK